MTPEDDDAAVAAYMGRFFPGRVPAADSDDDHAPVDPEDAAVDAYVRDRFPGRFQRSP